MALVDQLHLQADRIESVLAVHHAPGRVTGGRVTLRTIQFHLTPAPTTRLQRIQGLAEEIALALGAPSAQITRAQNRVHIEIPRTDARALRLVDLWSHADQDAQQLRALRVAGTTLVGMAADGMPLLLRLGTADVPHVLIAGTTGSGKSQAARSLLATLAAFQKPRQVQLLIVDPKGSDFAGFAELPHLVCPIVTTAGDTQERMEWLAEEMARRQASGVKRPRIVVLLDEMADLLMQGGSGIETLLTRLVQRGRSAGICLIGCTQKPTAGVLGTLVKANFPVRLVGKVTSAHEALIAAGIARSGAEKLGGRGDFLLIANGDKTRVQIAHLTGGDERVMLARAVHSV